MAASLVWCVPGVVTGDVVEERLGLVVVTGGGPSLLLFRGGLSGRLLLLRSRRVHHLLLSVQSLLRFLSVWRLYLITLIPPL